MRIPDHQLEPRSMRWFRFHSGLCPRACTWHTGLRDVPRAKTRCSGNLKNPKPPLYSSRPEDSKNALGSAIPPILADLHRPASVWPCLRAGFSAQRTPGHHFLQLHRPTAQAHQCRFSIQKNGHIRSGADFQNLKSPIPQFLKFSIFP